MLKDRTIRNFFRIVTGLMLWGGMAAFAADSPSTNSVSAGFLYDKFRLTLADGERTEAAGPFFYSEINTEDQTLAFPPFYSDYKQPGVDAGEYDILYPLLTCEHYSDERRWQFAQVLSFAGGRQPDETLTRRFTFFPFYFQ